MPPLRSLLPANGELFTWKVMLIVGSSTVRAGNCLGRVERADRVGDAEVRDAGDGDDVAGFGLVDFQALQAHEAEHLHHLALALLAFAIDRR